MRQKFLIASALVAALSACGEPTPTAEADAKPVVAPEKASTAAGADAVTPEFMTGKWALESDGDCKLSQDFKTDGSVDGLYESWKLEDDKLVAKLGDESITMTVKKIDDKHVEATVNGQTQRMVRC